MRIASFNLESLDLPPRAGRTIEDRAQLLRPELERARADVLCLQEVNSQTDPGTHKRTLAALDALLAGTRYGGYHRAVSTTGANAHLSDVHNLVTLSRWPFLSSRSLLHDLVPPFDHLPVTARHEDSVGVAPVPVHFDRPVLHTRIAVAGGAQIDVVNCHLRAPLASPIPGQKIAPFVWASVAGWAEGFCLSTIKRNAQALEVRLLVDQLFAENRNAAVLVAGDFNAEDYESPIRILAGAEQDTGNGMLAAETLVVLDRGIPHDRRFSVVHQGRAQMLDHILASRSLYGRLRSIAVFNEGLADEAIGYARVDRPAGSYHALVVAEFRGSGLSGAYADC